MFGGKYIKGRLSFRGDTKTKFRMGGKQEQIEQWIKENKVFVASKSYCPFCQQTKDLLKSLGVDAYIIELDQRGKYIYMSNNEQWY